MCRDYISSLSEIPELLVVPRKKTKHEKKMAKIMEKVVNYTWSTAKNSRMLKTPWGVLMWTPKGKLID